MANKIAEKVFLVTSDDWLGAVRAPGAGLAREWVELDGRKLLIVCKGDVFEVYHGRRDPIVFAVSPRILLSVVFWLLWSWWIKRTWCGLRTRVWAYALGRLADAAKPDAR